MIKKYYLRNNICKFYPLFDINYKKKKILISTVLFKLYGGSYKSFSKYIDGLTQLSKLVHEHYNYMTIRLFIDNTIYQDKSLMKQLNKLDIEIVLFVPRKQFTIQGHLKGLFGTLIRFFPMFDFPNNDCDICVSSDIDIPYDDSFEDRLIGIDEKINIIFNDIIQNISINYVSLLETSKKYYNVKNFKLLPYFYADRFITRDKLDSNILTDFIEGVETNNSLMTVYLGHKNTSMSYTNFVYGVDEYFTNNTMLDYIVESGKSISVYIEFDILTHLRKKLKLWNLKKIRDQSKYYQNLMGYVLGDEFYKKDPRKSFLILEEKVENFMENIDIVERLIESYILTYKNRNKEHDIISQNTTDVCTHSIFLGTIKFNGYIIYNNSEYNLIEDKEERLPQSSIDRLKKFKLNNEVYDVFDL